MSDTFLSRAEQQALINLLGEVGEVVEALAAALTTNGARTRISYEPRVTTGEREQPLPYNEDARIAADDLHNELGLWVQLVIDYRGIDYTDTDTPAAYARWLKLHIEALALTPGAQDAPRSISKAVKAAKRAARMASHREGWRGGSVHVARGTLLHATAIALAAKELGPEYAGLDRDRVNGLKKTGRIEPVRTNADGVPLYRLGDVMDAHLEAKTRRRMSA